MDVSDLVSQASEAQARLEDSTQEAEGQDVHPAVATFERVAETHRQILELAKTMEASIKTLRKELKKSCKKRRRTTGAPSNLMKPVKLSDELCDFLETERGTLMTRGRVTSLINSYATEKGLKKPENKRIIVVDKALAALLGVELSEEVQIFRVPKHLKLRNHYIKAEGDGDSA